MTAEQRLKEVQAALRGEVKSDLSTWQLLRAEAGIKRYIKRTGGKISGK